MRAAVARLSPVGVLLLVLGAASAFVTARWAVAADGDITRFVLAGSAYAQPDARVTVLPGPGYDGQFAYRLALDPTDLDGTREVALDSPLRLQRLTYPLLAAAVALGRDGWVPEALVLVNVLALGALGLLGALLARDAGRSPAAGLLLPAFSGFATTLGRDLTEAVTAALLVAGVLALQRSRPALAAGALAGAALSRESALLLAVVLLGVHLVVRRPPVREAVWALLPPAVFAGWQAVCLARVGTVPLLSSSGKNLVLPLQDLAPATVGWVTGAAALQRADLITLGQAVALAVLVVGAGRSLRGAPPALGAAWAAALLLVLALSENVWKGPADLRTASELAVLSGVLLLQGERSLRLPATVLTASLAGTVLFRVTSL